MRPPIVALFTLLAACEAGTTTGGRDAARSDGARGDGGADATARGDGASDSGAGDGGVTSDVIASGTPRLEVCGNRFDDDDNGIIDDGCDCAVGTSRACWLGPPSSRGVGACHDGVQRCESDGTYSTWTFCADATQPAREVLSNGVDDDCDGTTDEPDGICVGRANVETGTDCTNGLDDDCDTLVDCADPGCAGSGRCTPSCVVRETVCWGGADEDCDMLVDCADSDCAAEPSCQTGPCPPGQTPTYRQRALGMSWGASNIAAGDGQPVMTVSCEPGGCSRGEVAVVLTGRMAICVPPPRACPAGQHPTYVASGAWRCDPPCDLVVHYGSIFGGRNVCAGRPMLSCGTGQVPTFVESSESWMCLPTCNNTLYDQIILGGMLVCVPC